MCAANDLMDCECHPPLCPRHAPRASESLSVSRLPLLPNRPCLPPRPTRSGFPHAGLLIHISLPPMSDAVCFVLYTSHRLPPCYAVSFMLSNCLLSNRFCPPAYRAVRRMPPSREDEPPCFPHPTPPETNQSSALCLYPSALSPQFSRPRRAPVLDSRTANCPVRPQQMTALNCSTDALLQLTPKCVTCVKLALDFSGRMGAKN